MCVQFIDRKTLAEILVGDKGDLRVNIYSQTFFLRVVYILVALNDRTLVPVSERLKRSACKENVKSVFLLSVPSVLRWE